MFYSTHKDLLNGALSLDSEYFNDTKRAVKYVPRVDEVENLYRHHARFVDLRQDLAASSIRNSVDCLKKAWEKTADIRNLFNEEEQAIIHASLVALITEYHKKRKRLAMTRKVGKVDVNPAASKAADLYEDLSNQLSDHLDDIDSSMDEGEDEGENEDEGQVQDACPEVRAPHAQVVSIEEGKCLQFGAIMASTLPEGYTCDDALRNLEVSYAVIARCMVEISNKSCIRDTPRPCPKVSRSTAQKAPSDVKDKLVHFMRALLKGLGSIDTEWIIESMGLFMDGL